ncbi:mitochondrial genome maintenance MGM101 [Aspergillus eucalypticola CBS 122712]|uniref:Mitochondrial genome maintenance protein MGM101 n=1 Tax=Aspergillus eucalypticola (strain CBS 122712 / IBT 29274) TaxID=1448314 RepID=A0A317V6H1_ASPEC|nr:mitochondrial genome maintenance MGM101 [Aspergillus eucalypticola CBS 122712]PWY69954.1 mitochondrial genome maintenance MGM101 [Aspergillus eucalypticola CBS 122712]
MSLPLLTRSLRGPQLSKTLRQSLTTTTRYQSTTTTNNNTAKPATTSTTSTTPKPTTTTSTSSTSTPKTTPTLKDLLDTPPSPTNPTEDRIDWTRSFHGLSATPFPKECADILLAPTDPEEVEIKPDGILYLPEIKYRRILNKAFGPGGWGLVPRSESIVTPKMVTREYALVCNGRLVSVARGEQDYFSPDGIPTATEGCRSNALVRCCKDLGIASELWDPRWIRKFKAQYTREAFVEHVVNKRKTKIWVRKDDTVGYPWKETKF